MKNDAQGKGKRENESDNTATIRGNMRRKKKEIFSFGKILVSPFIYIPNNKD